MSDIQDVVYVSDENGGQVFAKARPIRALVREESKFAKHPVEDGTEITDNRVILPIELELHLILDSATYVSTFNEIRGYYLNATKLSVQTKVAVYDGLYIECMPHDEDAERFDTVAVALKLCQVIFVTAQFSQLPDAGPNDKSTTQTGQKQSGNANANQESAAFALIHGTGH